MTEEEKKAKAKEEAAQAINRVAKSVVEKPNKKSVNGRLNNIIENADKQEKLEKQQAKESEKKLSKEDKAINKAKKKVEEAKKKLEEAKAKNNEKAIKKAEKDLEKAKKDLEKAKKAKQEKEKMDLKDLAKKSKDVEAKLDKAGVKKKEAPNKDKDDKSKDKEKDKDKDKNKDKTNSNDQKAKLASKINVDGMNIQQHADKYVLVAKNGREIDVTDVMNQIDKYNKGVDAQNAAAKAEGAVKSGIDSKAKDMNAKDAGLPTNGANGNVIVKGTPELVPNIPAPQQKAAEDLAGKSMPNLEADEKALVAKTALELSKADLLKDPKGLEKLNERKKENDEKERKQQQMKLQQQQVAGR